MPAPHALSEQLLTPGEVAQRLGVQPRTIWAWARSGRIASSRTLGGHRRYRESDILALASGGAR